ncbi:hypothetical protein MTO96_009155 [Rhipicephalus appendiculatus]
MQGTLRQSELHEKEAWRAENYIQGHCTRDVCDRLWFDNQISSLSGICSDDQSGRAFDVIREYYPGLGDPAGVRVCGPCKDTLGKLPTFSTGNGCVYPPMPEGLPKLNDLEERMVAPRRLFMCVHVSVNDGRSVF